MADELSTADSVLICTPMNTCTINFGWLFPGPSKREVAEVELGLHRLTEHAVSSKRLCSSQRHLSGSALGHIQTQIVIDRVCQIQPGSQILLGRSDGRMP